MLPEWKAARHVCTFIGSKPGEVSTMGLIQAALNSGKPVCVPVIDRASKELLLSPVIDAGKLVRGHYDILEPENSPRLAPGSLDWDLALVPGVAFGRDGGRIGFGKGYYDRLLSARTTLRIALAFSFQVLDTVPTLPHDIPVDIIVTERETIRIS
jgi:5-formyltetrahydrofolate cyclo-ligase